MTMKCTAGPWYVAYIDENGQSVVSGEHTEVATCWHHCVGSIEQEMHANARLIAAAPDLLAAARLGAEYDDLLRSYAGPHETLFSGDVLSIDEAYDRWANATRAAIAKATGTA